MTGAGFKSAQGVDQSTTLVFVTGLAVKYPPDDLHGEPVSNCCACRYGVKMGSKRSLTGM